MTPAQIASALWLSGVLAAFVWLLRRYEGARVVAGFFAIICAACLAVGLTYAALVELGVMRS